eukprot:TRINITY_DN3206_c0_g2_i1.p1 TRINITY_DN3206_c0_g2~~TRINITY_DN3206_c0_g2_i1.p1  ORF type:complete len:745 (+),score=193.51 TRINITY_DN3206_c0_g2_i1:97-2235(+)
MAPWDCVVARALRDGEPPAEAQRKQVLLPVCLIIGVPAALWFLYIAHWMVRTDWGNPTKRRQTIVVQVVLLSTTVLQFAVLGHVLRTKRLALRTAEIAVVLVMPVVFLLDYWCLDFAKTSVWFLNVLVIDLLLTLGASRRSSEIVCAGTIVWTCGTTIVQAMLGEYEAPGWAVGYWMLTGLVLATDFHCTRTFAESMRQQKAMVDAAICVSEQAAVCLSRYEVEEARMVVEGPDGEGLPDTLRDAYRLLVHNLETYKAYLPQSCLQRQGAEEHSSAPSPTPRAPSPVDDDGLSDLLSETQRSVDSHRVYPTSELARGYPTSELCTVVSSGLELPRRQSGRSVRASPALPITASSGTAGGPGTASSRRSSGPPHSALALSTGAGQQHDSPHTPRSEASRASSRLDRLTSLGAISTPPVGKVASLIAANRIAFLKHVSAHDPEAVAAAVSRDMSAFALCTAATRGVIDLVSGDHRFASFGAAGRCPSHRAAAVQCVWQYAGHAPLFPDCGVAASVCCGQLLCGDFGGSEVRRFMLIGGLPCALAALERLASSWAAPCVIDHKVHNEVGTAWTCRLRDRVLFPKRAPEPFLVWEVVAPPPASQGQEWMYELQQHQNANPWALYNKALGMYLRSGGAAAERDAASGAEAAQAAEGTPGQGAVADAFQELLDRMGSLGGSSAPPPRLLGDIYYADAPRSSPYCPPQQQPQTRVRTPE